MPPKKVTKPAPKLTQELAELPKTADMTSPPKEAPGDGLLTPVQPRTERPDLLAADLVHPSLSARLSALKINGLEDEAEQPAADNEPAAQSTLQDSPTRSPEEKLLDEPVVEDEDEGYIIDDPDEEADHEALSTIASKLKYTLTLLVPFRHESEVPRTADAVAAHLDHWKEDFSAEAQTTTTSQKLTPAYLSKTCFGRLQVVFTSEDDAYYVRQRKIEHVTLKGETLELTWQFPEDSTYVHMRALHPQAIEVVLKGVPAEVTPEAVNSLLVEVKMVKRGKTTYKEGFGFHRVQDPVTGLDTDKIRDMVVQHENDRYRWRHFIEEPAKRGKKILLHFPSVTCDFCNGHHLTRYHDAYVTDHQANIAKWNLTKAGGAAVLVFSPEVQLLDVVKHASGRLISVGLRWKELELRLVAVYLPAHAGIRSVFLRDCLFPFLDRMPAATHTMLMGDFNLVEDPKLDKTSKLGSMAENQRLLNGCVGLDLHDAFRTLHPMKKEFTFYSRSARVSLRIDRVLVSASMLGCIGGAFHTSIPKGISDHWFAISVKLTSSEGKGKGDNTTAGCGDDDFVKTLKKLNAGLKKYAKGERRVARIVEHLEEKVAVLRQAFMSDAGSLDLQEQLARSEAQLKAYWDGKNDWLQTLAGIQGELEGETASKFLTGKIASRRAKTEIQMLSVGGKTVTEAKEILLAASDFF
ncbi:unnamed protein product [Closterium sp. NIES-64]|nr:unnamed protein product [Closterium sp. NIES-64]